MSSRDIEKYEVWFTFEKLVPSSEHNLSSVRHSHEVWVNEHVWRQTSIKP
jgi:hypothetical protein